MKIANKKCNLPTCCYTSHDRFVATAADGTTAEVIHGDAFEVMAGFKPGSYDAIVTDWPYNVLKKRGAEWDTEPFPIEEFLALCDRCLSPTRAQMVLFCSSKQLERTEEFLSSLKDENGDQKFRVIDAFWAKQNPRPYLPGITNAKENVVIAYTRDCDHLHRRCDAPHNIVGSGIITPQERVWVDDSGANESLHPAQKPVETTTKFLLRYVARGSRVLDGLGGTIGIGRACFVNGYDSTSIEQNSAYFERGTLAFSDPRIMSACYKRQAVGQDSLSLGNKILRNVDRILAGESYITAEKRAKIVEKIGKIRGMGLVKNL